MNILMLEDNPGDARLIDELLKDVAGVDYRFEQVDGLASGVERIKANSIDVVLLDLGLRDSQGLDTLSSLATQAQKMPIIVMTGLDDESTAVRALHQGAQDYLIKGQVEGNTLWRSLRYAVERKRVQRQTELSLKILEILNRPGDQKTVIGHILMLIKDFSGCEAVGIRLKDAQGYPYYSVSGFSPVHVEAENDLCLIDDSGELVLDSSGNPLLECACGMVIRGRYAASLPYFTSAGTLWCNSTTDLLASRSIRGGTVRVRTMCNEEGYESLALIPLSTEKGNFGLLQLCDRRRDHFSPEFVYFLEGIAQSVGVVLARKHAEEKLLSSYAALKKTLGDAINTLVKVVEMRDPYTAGHQHRVAALAIEIAKEMGLDDIHVEQLRMAAVVHDVGKIYIPSDLLSKPGKLTPLESQMIKTHALGGFDIVKDMDFPCVIAQCILQHHERLDGSGYPNQLKNEQIVLEARILAVADVVEAMASHRPYRPALGLDKALEEITAKSGVLYDRDAVSACRRLFLERGYQLEQPPQA